MTTYATAIQSALHSIERGRTVSSVDLESSANAFRLLWNWVVDVYALPRSEEVYRLVLTEAILDNRDSLDEIEFCLKSLDERTQAITLKGRDWPEDSLLTKVLGPESRGLVQFRDFLFDHIVLLRSSVFSPTTATQVEGLRHRLRQLCKYCAAAWDLDSWQSPSHQGSTDLIESGATQRNNVEPYTHDYRRWSLGTELRPWEESFSESAFAKDEMYRLNPVSVLTSSGMTALRLSLDWSASELEQPFTVIVPTSAYFEIRWMLRPNVARVISMQDHGCDSYGTPFVAIIEPVSNAITRVRNDLRRIVAVLSRQNAQGVVIIDRSILGPLFQPSRIFGELPTNIRVVCAESLLKNFQFGLELGQGGVATVFAPAEETERIRVGLTELRAANGLLPGDTHFLSYPRIHLGHTLSRLKRQSRNAALFAGCIDSYGTSWPGWQSSYPQGYGELDPDYRGSLVSVVNLSHEELSFYNQIIESCVSWAGRVHLPINVGLGFGFNTTRLGACVHNLNEPGQRFYLRIAAGAETLMSAILLSAIFVSTFASNSAD